MHDTLAHYAQEHARGLGNIKGQLEQGFARNDGNIAKLRDLLVSLRSHVKNLESASEAERKTISAALDAQQANWRKAMNEQQQHWQQAHAAHAKLLKGLSKAAKKLANIEANTSLLIEALPQKPTAKQLLGESSTLAEAGSFEQAAIKAEEACILAEKEADAGLFWKASLNAARGWFNHGCNGHPSEAVHDYLSTRIAANIEAAEKAGAPAGKLALARGLLAAHRRDNEGFIQSSAAALADPSCDEFERAEAMAMRLQALLLGGRMDEALSSSGEVEGLRGNAEGEQLLVIEASWLRILCDAQLATDEDVGHFIALAERLKEPPPKRRLFHMNLVIRVFSRAAQEPAEPVAAALIVERLNKLKRLSNDFAAETNQILESFASHEPSTEPDSRLNELKKALDGLLESARPNTGDRHDQTLRLLEAGYAIMKPTGDAVTLMNLAGEIAEMSALRGDTVKTELFLGHCDNWVEASKDSPLEEGRSPWFSLRAKALTAKGRTLYRLGWRLLRDGRPAEAPLFSAKGALEEAHAFATEHRNQLHGSTELFLADTSFWLGQTTVQLGQNAKAAQHYLETRSPAAMAHDGFSKRIGMLAWLKEAESHCFAGEAGKAVEVVSRLMAAPNLSDEVAKQAQGFKRYLDSDVVPVIDWFSGPNARRIGEMAKCSGLKRAIAAQTKFLVDWHDQFFKGDGPPNLASAYDFWGRGGFSRISAAIRSVPESAIAVDAFTLEHVRVLARMLCPLFDTVVVKWKGAMGSDFGIGVFPDPAPEGDEFGDFFGGMGLVRCKYALIGPGNLLPKEIGEFLATEALPLIQSGRLILLPAPFVGCTQTAIGWTDDLLTRHFLKGVINGAAWDSDPMQGDANSINISQSAIPFIDGVSLPDLARVLEDASDFLAPLRKLVWSLRSNIARERLAAIHSVESGFTHLNSVGG